MPEWDDELDGEVTPTGDEANKSFKDLRNYSKKLERETKTMAAELEELKAFRNQVVEEKREAALGSVFTEVGLSPTHAKLFKALNPEIEPEAITSDVVVGWAKEYELISADAPAPVVEQSKPQGFTPVTIGQPAGLKTYTQEEIQGLLRQGAMDEVNRAYKEGRVEKPSVPWTR